MISKLHVVSWFNKQQEPRPSTFRTSDLLRFSFSLPLISLSASPFIQIDPWWWMILLKLAGWQNFSATEIKSKHIVYVDCAALGPWHVSFFFYYRQASRFSLFPPEYSALPPSGFVCLEVSSILPHGLTLPNIQPHCCLVTMVTVQLSPKPTQSPGSAGSKGMESIHLYVCQTRQNSKPSLSHRNLLQTIGTGSMLDQVSRGPYWRPDGCPLWWDKAVGPWRPQ